MAAKSKLLTERQKQNRNLLMGLIFLAIFSGVFFLGTQFRAPAVEDSPRDMKQLLRTEPASSYELTVRDTDSAILVIAPHGGTIEPFTSTIASGIAGEAFDYFEFKGLLEKDAYARLHIPSIHYNPDELRDINLASEVTLSVHSVSGKDKTIYLGGRDEMGVQILQRHLQEAGFHVEAAPEDHAGLDPRNFVNKNGRGMGIQMEMTLSQRRALFTKRDEARPNKTYDQFTKAVADALIEIEAAIVE